MIFEIDHTSQLPAVTGRQHFRCNRGRVFTILHDPASWQQDVVPRIVSATAPERLVYSFSSGERATATISSWTPEFSELEIVVDGCSDEASEQRQIQYWNQVVSNISTRLASDDVVVATSPGKVNIYFAVGPFLKDGFHEVASCYQALSLREQLQVELTGEFAIKFSGPFAELSSQLVPTDQTNLVYRAGAALAELDNKVLVDRVSFLIHKSVPIAGGMAGGSADAAAALVGLNRLFGCNLDPRLEELAANLGSDVPFSLSGGTAIGLGRGEILTPVASSGVLHWVITPSSLGLSTPEVYRKLDTMRVEEGIDVSRLETPAVPQELIDALNAGDPLEVAQFMHNDLERAALALRPELGELLQQGRKSGALKSMVSGSGPSIIHLAKNRIHAQQIASRLSLAGFPSIASYTSHSGTRVER
jgi:4-diphosphocytidyl-2-C-methyl-D-erythritol kinase